ncbi:MAG: pyridoxine 5'-phosphate synthase [Myxococcota bacterium]
MRRRRFSLRIDHVATLRQVRRATLPDPVAAALAAELVGVDGIVAHLREDRRHIQERDARLLRQLVRTSLTLELAPTQEMLKLAYDIKPDAITLVPEQRDEATTERGLDVARDRDHLRKYVQSLRDADIDVILLIEPDLDHVRTVHRIDVTAVELHTGKYAQARSLVDRRTELQRLVDAARAANKLGMRVSASHSLSYQNIAALVPIDEIEQFVVGHAVVAQSLMVGLERAVRDMQQLLAS